MNRRVLAGIAVAVILSGLSGYWLASWSSWSDTMAEEQQLKRFPFLAKRILVDSPNDPLLNFVPLRENVTNKLNAYGSEYSLYFEYLPTGTSFGVGDSEELVAASLIKLPFVMDLYHAAELNKLNLDTEIELTEDVLNSQYGDLYKRGVGSKLSLREAAKYALTQSDNTAILLIQKYLKGKLEADETAIAAVDADFQTAGDTVLMNSRSYSSILKCLYFACYVNKSSSNEILSMLTKSEFTNRIAAGAPASVPVAHKIGVNYSVLSQSDCGIFFVPKRPYVLCVMLGGTEDKALPVMREISELIYRSVSSQ